VPHLEMELKRECGGRGRIRMGYSFVSFQPARVLRQNIPLVDTVFNTIVSPRRYVGNYFLPYLYSMLNIIELY